MGSAERDEVFWGFLVEVLEFVPFGWGLVVGDPGLTAFGLAADPIAEDVTLIGVALVLDGLEVVEEAAHAAAGWGIGRDGFDAEVKFGKAR